VSEDLDHVCPGPCRIACAVAVSVDAAGGRRTTGKTSWGPPGKAAPGPSPRAAASHIGAPPHVRAPPLTGDQEALLADLKHAAEKAAEAFKLSCPRGFALTPGRLQTMIARLEAMLEALRIVRPVLVVSWIAPSAES
jgi:hypothetical protein